jgi:hypothetical protein
MAYVIEFYRNNRRMGLRPWTDDDLAAAKAHAIKSMSDYNATHVAVIDDDTRQIVYAYPEPTDA